MNVVLLIKYNNMIRGTKNYMYDLVIIGAGSGGVRAGRIAASHGASVS